MKDVVQNPAQTAAHRVTRRGTSPARILRWGSVLTVVAGGLTWTSLVLLAHIWPALFPGQTLKLTAPNAFSSRISLPEIPVPNVITDAIKIETPPETVFNRPLIILVVGTDTSVDLASLRTDTILLARVDPVTKSVNLLSIPRDLMIDITAADGSVYQDRINVSFGQGAAKDDTIKSGMEHLAADIERNFGIATDYWVQVDFRGAERLFDVLGGVDVVIPEELSQYDWWYSDNDRPARYLDFPPGEQHLSGYEAVAFSRLREFDNDFKRIERQQIVMEAAMAQAFNKGLLNNVPSLWGAYHDAVVTNIETARIPGFGLLARDTRGRIETYSLADNVNDTQTMFDVTLRSGAEVLQGNPENMKYWIDIALRGIPPVTPTPVATPVVASGGGISASP